MPTVILARPPYAKRPLPATYDRTWWQVELGNLERAIPSFRVRTASADDRVTTQDFTVLYDASAGPIAATLPSPDQAQGLLVTLKKTDVSANAVTVVGTVDGVAGRTLSAQYDAVTVQSDGSQWLLLGQV